MVLPQDYVGKIDNLATHRVAIREYGHVELGDAVCLSFVDDDTIIGSF